MSDDAAVELKGRVSRIVGVGIVWLAVLVDALWNMCRTEAAHGLHLAEQIVEHVAPVAEHIQNDAAAFGLAIVPAWPLRRLAPIAFEHPVAELAANGEHAAEKTGVAQHSDLAQSRQKQRVLDDAVFLLVCFGEFRYCDRFVEPVGNRLFAID